jgi:D-aspartate ligase
VTGASAAVAVFDNYWAPTLAFALSLGRRGVPIHVYGSGGAGRWSRYCTKHRSCPPVEQAEEFLPWLQQRVRTGEILNVAPTTDLMAFYLSLLRDEFPPDARRAIAPLAEIETTLFKPRFSAACTAMMQPVPVTRVPESSEAAVIAARELGYPLILKPKSHIVVGPAERGYLIEDEPELLRRFRPYSVVRGQALLAERYPELLWPLLQRYVPSARQRVYSVSGFKDPDSGVVCAALSYKREQWPPDVGTSTVQVSYQDESILQTGVRLVDRLLSRGLFEVELLADTDGLLAIDLNPRAHGFINLDIALGHDLPWLWLCSTCGPVSPLIETPPRRALEARHSVLYFLRRLADWRFGGSRAPQVERRSPERPRGSIPILGHWTDPVPMLLSHATLLRNPRSLIRKHVLSSRLSSREGRVSTQAAPNR